MTDTNVSRLTRSAYPTEPAAWWRVLCTVADSRLIITGDLPHPIADRTALLQQWADAGVTDIVDCRIERTDETFVADLQPHIRYHWVGVDDDGGYQPDSWFDEGVAAAVEALRDPDAIVLVHCHMGVNRGPSMAFAILLELGWDALDALAAIRTARPIAGVIYAAQALSWWHRRRGSEQELHQRDEVRVAQWFRRNPLDVSWIVSRIWRADVA
jgi:protein-tyrosine phosphatase